MVIDTSALIAIILDEDEALPFEDLVLRAPVAVMSTASVLEATMVLHGKCIGYDVAKIDEMIRDLGIDVRGIDLNQGAIARRAFLSYGKGNGPANLNFGDCFAYALAKARDDTLLFKGDDFIHTDIVPAWRP
jgi:ribonuclease VapC